jgi:hypothetical protein
MLLHDYPRAEVGTSTREVMARGGWSSPQMALRYVLEGISPVGG